MSNRKVKINFFYVAGFNTGGVPNDIRDLISSLSNHASVYLYAISRSNIRFKYLFKTVKCKYLIYLLWTIIKNRKKLRSNFNLIVGGFIWQNIFIAVIFSILNIKFQLQNLGHFSPYILKNKLFKKNIVYKNNENSVFKEEKINFLNQFISIIRKYIYFNTFGNFLILFSQAIWVSSEFEKNQIIKLNPKARNKKYIYYSFGINTNLDRKKNYKYDLFRDNINIVFWGRLDYFNKGLDRVLNALEIDKSYFINNKIIFHMYGPSYNDGRNILISEVNRRNLNQIFNIPNQSEIESIDFGGFYWADGTIFLTRWEAHPRVVRESIFYKVPILLSQESNFCDNHLNYIKEIRGKDVLFPDDPEYTLKKIKEFVTGLKTYHDKKIDIKDTSTCPFPINWDLISKSIIDQL